MYENEMTGVNGAPSKTMSVVSNTVYTAMQVLLVAPATQKVAQDSLPSHRNSHR
jgi:hypothetical protein